MKRYCLQWVVSEPVICGLRVCAAAPTQMCLAGAIDLSKRRVSPEDIAHHEIKYSKSCAVRA